MPVQPTYPGVYIEEIPSGVHTITGVATSITAFLGTASRGPVNDPKHIFSQSDYERYFGGLSADSDMSFAVSQFFQNGGSEAWIVRLAKDPKPAALDLLDAAGNKALTITARDEGLAGNDVHVLVQQNILNPNNFDITFTYVSRDNPADSRVETFKNVSLDKQDPRFAGDMINDVSQLVTVKEVDAPAPAPPAAGGGGATPAGGGGGAGTGGATGSTALVKRLPVAVGPAAGSLTSGAFADKDLDALPGDKSNSFMISIDGDAPALITLDSTKAAGSDLASKLGDIASRIQNQVRKAKTASEAYRKFTCTADTANKQLALTSGTIDANSSVAVTAAPANDIAKALHLLDGTTPKAGGNPALTGGAGAPFTLDEAFDVYIGDRLKREGIYALESVDLFNLLCLPGVTDPGILAEAITYCKERRAFMILDAPPDKVLPQAMVDYMNGPNLPKGEFGQYAAVYYPWVQAPDSLKNGKLRSFSPSGMIAGLYARTDTTRGVWKAPAGTDATLVGVRGVDYLMTDPENGSLNPHGVNCLRIFPVYGPVCWGSRTVSGDDQIASEYKYIPIRRLALYIEESLYRGTKWVVFEPNDEPLWAQIRLNIGAFMHNLFRKGAFQGQTPKEAYFVKCDKETTTQNDRDLGIVNIVVGFAPLKPAEFVIIQLQQIAGDIQV